jgi:cytochrome c oxidase assembly factor CtaG
MVKCVEIAGSWWSLSRTLLVAAAVFLAAPVYAHEGHAHHGAQYWTLDPWVLLLIALAAVLYMRGLSVLWRKAGVGSGVRLWQAACFAGGWLTLFLALVSPVHWLGERLFSVHMIEHELVMAVAAPLLSLARPIGAFLWALPRTLRHAIGAIARRSTVVRGWRHCVDPLTATALHGIAIWLWHIPALFDAAVQYPAMHRLQHMSFFVTALLFWWALVRRPLHDYGAAALHVAATMIHTSLLGVLLTLSPRLLYAPRLDYVAAWGLSPLEDQQLAGLIMWIPAGLIYAAAALAFAGLWVAHSGGSATKVHDHAVHAG